MGDLNCIFAYLSLIFFKGKTLKAIVFPQKAQNLLEKEKNGVISERILKCFRQLG